MSSMIRVLMALACAVVCALAQAQGYPAKAVRIVVPNPPGGSADTLARVIAQPLSAVLGQQVLVENRPGANAIIATGYVAKSDADGYMLLFSDASLLNNSFLYSKLPYDPLKDLVPITGMVTLTQAVVVSPSLPVKNIRELIDLAKTKPGELSYATFGIGSTGHLLLEMLQTMAGIKLTHVPYKGGSAALIDVTAGRVQIAYTSMSQLLPQWKAGKVNLLAVDGARRLAQHPDVPTMAETLPGLESSAWFGLHAPARTPREVIPKIHGEVQKIVADPAFRAKNLVPNAFEPILSSSEQFSEYIKREALRWAKVARDANVKLDE